MAFKIIVKTSYGEFEYNTYGFASGCSCLTIYQEFDSPAVFNLDNVESIEIPSG